LNLFVALAILYITSKSHENKLLLLLSACPFNLKKVVKRPSFVKRLAYPPHAGVFRGAVFCSLRRGLYKGPYVSVLLCTPHTECPFCYFYRSGVVNLLYVAAAISILGLLVNLMLLFSFCTVSRINKRTVL